VSVPDQTPLKHPQADLPRDQHPQVPNHSIPRCPPATLRVRQAGRAPHLSKPRGPRSLGAPCADLGRRRHR
jgi:hypothetical protein